jgi:hypothetical protein
MNAKTAKTAEANLFFANCAAFSFLGLVNNS